jgi:hypothetical protein
MTTEMEATKGIIDEIYAVREKIYNETKDLSGAEYIAYFNNNAQDALAKSGYKLVYLSDGRGYKITK